MSDPVKHECGIALIRLLKPLEYYPTRYGTTVYGLEKLQLLMEKQHNRGQDGAGIANIKFDLRPGNKYINRFRSNDESPIKAVFDNVFNQFEEVKKKSLLKDVNWMKMNLPFTGELFLGHLRYGTYGKNSLKQLHPAIRRNNWKTRNLSIAGNFNMTNVDELFERLIGFGQSPVETSDTITILEKIGHFLDEQNEKLYQFFKEKNYSKREISALIADSLNIKKILERSASDWDGGYTIAGLLGHGDAFVMRDPSGIRPAFYYYDDEVFVAASERPAIQTAFKLEYDEIKELKPGNVVIVKKNGEISEVPFAKSKKQLSCSFERIYFSRGTDVDIYNERKKLGELLSKSILKTIDFDIKNTVFSYIPNTAAVAFLGLIKGLTDFCDTVKKQELKNPDIINDDKKLEKVLSLHPRIENIIVKDAKLRTFISQDTGRKNLVAHVYDITYGSLKKGEDNLVIIDDSIVRGTTLKQSIVGILDRLGPKKIIIASSAPQIRYPDCYGIDMAKLSDFIAFNATIQLLKEKNMDDVINKVYRKCKEQEFAPIEEVVNYVKEIYEPFSPQQISEKIAELVTPDYVKTEIKVVYQSIENLHLACPQHRGDWYFTGDYPTPGGNKVAIRSFINYIEKKDKRAY